MVDLHQILSRQFDFGLVWTILMPTLLKDLNGHFMHIVWIGDWVGATSSLDAVVMRKRFVPARNCNLAAHFVAIHYAD
jgi:hypothetical protein